MGVSERPVFLLLCIIVLFACFQLYTFLGVNHTFSQLLKQSLSEDRIVSNSFVSGEGSSSVSNAEMNTERQSAVKVSPSAQEHRSVLTASVTSRKESRGQPNGGKEYHYPGNRRTALVIVAYNRPGYLKRTFDSLIDTLSSPQNRVKVDIVLSQDGYLSVLNGVVDEARKRIQTSLPAFSFRHIHHNQENLPGDSGYHKLSRHFGWFLNEMFNNDKYEQVIILEDDLEIAPDFFEYFDATSPLLWKDPSLFCISAWNDNGQADHVSDPERLYRTDFFPGLGWMLTDALWRELGASWPAAYWDDWLRHPDRRQGRACIRPEVSRSYTFGEKGTSNAQFFGQYLRGIKKNDRFVEFTKKDVEFLLKERFDPLWLREIEQARVVSSVDEIPPSSSAAYKMYYDFAGGSAAFRRIAHALRIMEDEKAGVFRTAYMGVVAVKVHGTQLYLVPREGPSFQYKS